MSLCSWRTQHNYFHFRTNWIMSCSFLLSPHLIGPKYGYRAKREGTCCTKRREWTRSRFKRGMKKWNLSLESSEKGEKPDAVAAARYLDRDRRPSWDETKNGCKQSVVNKTTNRKHVWWPIRKSDRPSHLHQHQMQQFKRKKKLLLMESWKGVRPSRSLTQFVEVPPRQSCPSTV